jgi:hypothetical protein
MTPEVSIVQWGIMPSACGFWTHSKWLSLQRLYSCCNFKISVGLCIINHPVWVRDSRGMIYKLKVLRWHPLSYYLLETHGKSTAAFEDGDHWFYPETQTNFWKDRNTSIPRKCYFLNRSGFHPYLEPLGTHAYR